MNSLLLCISWACSGLEPDMRNDEVDPTGYVLRYASRLLSLSFISLPFLCPLSFLPHQMGREVTFTYVQMNQPYLS